MSWLFAIMAAEALSLSCEVSPPRSVLPDGDAVKSGVIGLPPEMKGWKFALAITPRQDTIDVELNWPGDPIRAGKALAAMEIGKHDYSFLSIHRGPCLFTVKSCMFLYTVSAQEDGSADILIQPTALGTDKDRSKPFQVYMAGRCVPRGRGS